MTKDIQNTNNLFLDGINTINTSGASNECLEYYYYVPKSIVNKDKSSPLLICIPGLSANGKRFVNNHFKQFAQDQEFIIISPSFKFDQNDWKENKSYQYPQHWSGKALLDIIKQINEQEYKTDDVYLYGFSAGAQFAIRFSLWKQNFCKAVIAHARGGSLIRPNVKLETKYFLTVGKQDISRIENTEVFYYGCEWLNTHAIYKLYDCDHTIPDQQIFDSIQFMTDVKNNSLSIFNK